MTETWKRQLFGLAVCLAAGFGVFVLPFFFPPASAPVMSVSIDAGFNNKVAAVAAALCALAVFFGSVVSKTLAPRTENGDVAGVRPISYRWVAVAATLLGACVGFGAWLVNFSHLRYAGDAGYFINQLSSAVEYHRRLYSEIEFPYGPLIFYSPVALYHLLGGLGISLRASYFVMLVLHQMTGVLLLGYIVNALPMSRAWKIFALCCYTVFSLQPMLGVNYTLLRFAPPMATLLFSARRKKPGTTMVLFLLGEILNLSISPEMGFAFGAGAIAYALAQMWLAGRVWVWGVLAVPSGVALFLLAAGRPYLKMVGLFAGGVFNFIVEPAPFVVIFLAALVWIVPRMVAARWIERHRDATLLGACLVLSAALVPVAFGRADPTHVFFNGLGIFLLSLVAASRFTKGQQAAWGLCIAVCMWWGLTREFNLYERPVRLLVRHDRQLAAASAAAKRAGSPQVPLEPEFDGDALDVIVGRDSVATPMEITLQAEEVLKRRGQYRPSFYCFMMAVLDRNAEERKIGEMNQAKWAMLPTGVDLYGFDTQKNADVMIGVRLPYRMRRPSFLGGKLLEANLAARWVPVGKVGEYTIYRNTQVEPEQAHP